jgi:putative Flp pilus-assembly TadE/G-like protein
MDTMKTKIRHIQTPRNSAKERNAERGATLVMIAGGLALIVAAAALAIDLGSLYLQRSEAQRAADAGALAGAQVWANDSCALAANCLSAAVESAVTARATQVAQQNLIFGQTPTIPTPTFAAGGGSQTDPLVTVTAQAPAKTFFLPLSSGATISATATAEAYSPNTTSGPVICDSCLKPFFVPNCDPNHLSPLNSNCPTPAGMFFNNGTIANGTSILGEAWQLHLQTAGGVQQMVPSQWLEVDFSLTPPNCSANGGSQSATVWQQDVTQCSTKTITCGTQLCTMNGNKVGPNNQAVCQMIRYGGSGCNANGGTAVDSVSCSNGACTMTAGSGNPFATSGQTITQSSALVAVPVYDGTMQSGGGTVTVVGYMQLFIQDIQHQGQFDNIDAVIVSATTCGNLSGGGACSDPGGGSGTSGTASGGGATLVPVRLVHP